MLFISRPYNKVCVCFPLNKSNPLSHDGLCFMVCACVSVCVCTHVHVSVCVCVLFFLPVITVLWRVGQEGHELEASLGYAVRSSHKIDKMNPICVPQRENRLVCSEIKIFNVRCY